MSSLADSSRCEPNLVPILDMVFQLITFFMLVVNFKATEVDRDLILPVIGSTRPADEKTETNVLVLNVRGNGDVMVRGKVEPVFSLFINTEARIARANAEPGSKGLPTHIVVRGDRTLSVKTLMGVVDQCRGVGFDKFDFIVTQTAKK